MPYMECLGEVELKNPMIGSCLLGPEGWPALLRIVKLLMNEGQILQLTEMRTSRVAQGKMANDTTPHFTQSVDNL